jgi:hypothetical protein
MKIRFRQMTKKIVFSYLASLCENSQDTTFEANGKIERVRDVCAETFALKAFNHMNEQQSHHFNVHVVIKRDDL